MKNVIIWSEIGNEQGILLEKDDIEERGYAGFQSYILEITAEQKEEVISFGLEKLSEKIKQETNFQSNARRRSFGKSYRTHR